MPPLPELLTVLFTGLLAGHGDSGAPEVTAERGQLDWQALVQTQLSVRPPPAGVGASPALLLAPSGGAEDVKLEASSFPWPRLNLPFGGDQPLPALALSSTGHAVNATSASGGGVSPLGHAHLGFGYYSDALVAFLFAITASWALGGRCPQYTKGILPQISGFLFMGIAMGPYCTDILSRARLDLISSPINRICLSFIAGAAGVEMYLPELRSRLGAMALQVLLISIATLGLCFFGLFFLTAASVLAVPALEMQVTTAAKVVVTLLVATLMTARSPASAIAVIAELGCGELKAAKVCLGVTVCSDVVVLVLFALCMQLVKVVTQGSSFGPHVLLGVALQLVVSVLLGAAASLLFRLVIPRTSKEERQAEPWQWALTRLRGALVIGIMYAGTEVSVHMEGWTHEVLRLEPLLVCAAAACVSGHDESRRANLIESLMSWTQLMVLPFFTLAGASLELPGLWMVLPAAISLAVLRLLGIALGSTAAGVVSRRLYPGMRVSHTEICCTWLTLVAQAGVTLGLVMEARAAFRVWGEEFSTLVTSVVVINQLLGPVLCRFGLSLIIKAEEPAAKGDRAFETK